MIDTLVIVVYDRWDNVDKWLAILEKTGRPRNVVIIQNSDNDNELTLKTPKGTTHIVRRNIGFDIGALQDVCKDRLPGFPADWKQMLWCTDDTFPMTEDFLNYFALQPGEGCRAMEISPYVREHVRTTGFSITRDVARRLRWPADPVTTKQHCYLFEHRWHRNTLLDQVRAMGLTVKMVAPRETSPMFDTGYHRRQPRDKEFYQKWDFAIAPPAPIQAEGVTIICPIYQSFPAVISSLVMQTFKNWKLVLVHDGPGGEAVETFVNALNDDRITYQQNPKRVNNWGHRIRAEELQKVKTEYTLITNPDNQYVPVFLEYMLKPFIADPGTIASYCSHMVHSYRGWDTQRCVLQRGHVDCGGVLLKTKEAQAVGWHSEEHSADWFFFEAIIKRYGAARFKPVKGTLFVHN